MVINESVLCICSFDQVGVS
uniref:Uncharacterized protein n=1 Tax=Anguilla anguilla TaxID=7936 RepID=A0A0E9UDW0_ANGAN